MLLTGRQRGCQLSLLDRALVHNVISQGEIVLSFQDNNSTNYAVVGAGFVANEIMVHGLICIINILLNSTH